jgi:hypothetical protein
MMFYCAPVSSGRLSSVLLLFLALLVQSASAQQTEETTTSKAKTTQAPAAAAQNAEASHEDWGDLSITQSGLRVGEPLLGEKDDYPEFTRELLQVQWRASDPIYLYVVRPRGVENPPVILYLYSYPYEKPRFLNTDFCRRVTKDGFAAVGFMSALTGHRYHDRPMRKWFVSELREALGTSTHDVQLVLNYLASRGDLDMHRVGMFAEGSGAAIAILAAAADTRIKALDLYNPWGDWPDWLAKSSLVPETERADYLKPEFLAQVATLDPVQWLPKLGSRRIRIVHVRKDGTTPELCKKKIESAAPSLIQIVRYEDSQALIIASAKGQLFQWIKENVRDTPLQANKVWGGIE